MQFPEVIEPATKTMSEEQVKHILESLSQADKDLAEEMRQDGHSDYAIASWMMAFS